MKNIQILSAVKHNGSSIPFDELMNLTRADIQPDYVLTKNRIDALISSNLLTGNAEAFGTIHLTPQGRIYLDDILNEMESQKLQHAEETARQEQQQKKQFRHDWRVTVIGGSIQTIIGAIGGVLITLFLQWL